ncbi:effector-associated constant component EACC1 [Streptomyces sp. MMG1533]|uniref:effector-associated constant component EACC1 n=1 Tax=Streptomyces sp. MMG1533 TaxID=1415546 RepID=UPI0006AE8E12|nr:hypothetical protein [Streptomyces sp. MMG1533]
MTDFRIVISGSDDDAESLWDWLRQEPGLRGRVNRRTLPPPAGSMGSMVELVVEGLVGGTVGTLAGQLGLALSSWLTRSRAGRPREATLTITLADGQAVTLTSDNAALAVQLLQRAPGEQRSGETVTNNATPPS